MLNNLTMNRWSQAANNGKYSLDSHLHLDDELLHLMKSKKMEIQLEKHTANCTE
jgi:hypothetical protein